MVIAMFESSVDNHEEEKSKVIFDKKKTWFQNNLTNELRVKRCDKKNQQSKNEFEKVFKNRKKSRWCKNRKEKDHEGIKTTVNNFNLRPHDLKNAVLQLQKDLTSQSEINH